MASKLSRRERKAVKAKIPLSTSKPTTTTAAATAVARCAHCGQPATQVCGKCHVIWYCSRECQVTNHRIHGPVCNVNYSLEDVESMRSVAKLVLTKAMARVCLAYTLWLKERPRQEKCLLHVRYNLRCSTDSTALQIQVQIKPLDDLIVICQYDTQSAIGLGQILEPAHRNRTKMPILLEFTAGQEDARNLFQESNQQADKTMLTPLVIAYPLVEWTPLLAAICEGQYHHAMLSAPGTYSFTYINQAVELLAAAQAFKDARLVEQTEASQPDTVDDYNPQYLARVAEELTRIILLPE